MIKVVGVRFKNTGKMYYFNPNGFAIESGMQVIVETARGIEFGDVVSPIKEIEDGEAFQPLKNVIRIATEEDVRIHTENIAKERDAFRICNEKIEKHGLKMKLIDVEYTFDGLSKTSHLYLKRGLNSGRLASVTRQRRWVESGSVGALFAVRLPRANFSRFLLKWQRNKVYHSVPRKYPAHAGA